MAPFELWAFTSAFLILLFLLDDLFIDFYSLCFRLGPKMIPSIGRGEAPLAIMVANWQEYDVLEAMVSANSHLLLDKNVHIFLGVYPNDTKTLEIAQRMAVKFRQVHVAINPINGPTYKGQMLDVVIDSILAFEADSGICFEGFILHDSEDVISPTSIPLYREALRHNDFVQVPVLSLDLELKNFVGGTYLDEFSETHSKDLLVRQLLNAAIPSAGVGTCLKRTLVLDFKKAQNGRLFPTKDLTEDYILGLQASRLGLKSTFVCYYEVFDQKKHLVATREYFPCSIRAAIRQKTRWVHGVAFQGWERMGWFGSLAQRYFLWRDRKAIFSSLLGVNALVLLVALWTVGREGGNLEQLSFVFNANLALMSLRLLMRMHRSFFHYNLTQALLVPVRWPLATLINTAAALLAMQEYAKVKITGKEAAWKKTQHQFPTHLVNPNALRINEQESPA